MTLTQDRHPPAPVRLELDLVAQQLEAIASFTSAQRAAREAAAAAVASREMRLDHDRALEVMQREHEAVVARAHEQLRLSGQPTCGGSRIVLAHRNEWFLGKLSSLLGSRGWHVVAMLDNGADAVGVAVAEQPEVLLVEDALAMVTGEQVVREVRHYCPRTVVAAQVAYGDRIGALLEAGAAEVFTRQVPPDDVASRLVELVSA